MDESPQVPGADETVADLKEFLGIAETALHVGCLNTEAFFRREAKGKPIDRALAPNLVRYFAKRSLFEARQLVVEEDDQFDPQWIANNGLYVVVGRFHIRILKSENGSVPAPGQSLARQHFYQQISFRLSSEDGREPGSEQVNLILSWDVTSPYTLSSLILACPKGGGTTRESVELEWKVNLPLHIVAASSVLGTDDDEFEDLALKMVEPEEDEDLPLKLTKEASEDEDD